MNTMKTTPWKYLPIVTALVAAPLAAQPAMAKVTMAVMCKSYPDKKPTGITSTFKPSDKTIHCVFRLSPLVQGTARSVWTAVKVEGLAPNTKIYDAATKPMLLNGGHFFVENNQPWPRGSYRVDIYVNAKKLRSMPFSVK